MLRFPVIAALSLAIIGSQASAGTINFDDASGGLSVWSQEGFTFQNSSTYNNFTSLYLHDDSGAVSSTFTRQDGNLFNMLGGTVSAYSYLFKVVGGGASKGLRSLASTSNRAAVRLKPMPLAYSFSGYRDGVLVANIDQRATEYSSNWQDWLTTFSNLDTFKVSLLFPKDRVSYALDPQNFDRLLSPKTPGTIVCREWCGALWLDDLSYSLVAPVPVPPALPLLFAGVGALWFAARKRRREGAHLPA